MPFLDNKKLDFNILTIYIVLIVYLINIKYRGSPLLSKEFFLHPHDPMQRRYEALRALIVEQQGPEGVAQRFGYSIHTLRALMRNSQKEALPPFFLPLKQGPKAARQTTIQLKDRIVDLRKRNCAIDEIRETRLTGYTGSLRQIIVTGTGRKLPLILVTNDVQRPPKEILTL